MLQDILNHEAIKRLTKNIFQEKEIEILERPHSFIVKSKKEDKDFIERIIILPPQGYTSNKFDELSSHNEVCKAKITVEGIIKSDKKNFSLIKNCLQFSYLTRREATTEGTVPYALVYDNKNIHKEKILSSKETLYIVKENGEGFYHNLINTTNESVVLLLEKKLRTGKQMDIEKKIQKLKLSFLNKRLILELIKKIKEHGDNIFNNDVSLLGKVLNVKIDDLLPILIDGLNIYETGRHEPCTVYALILKKSKSDKIKTLKYLKKALDEESAPIYYLKELIRKIDSDSSDRTRHSKTY